MDYYQPASLREALDVLYSHQPKLLAGGTDIYPALQTPKLREPVLDISRIDGLAGIEKRHGHWRIGARATWTDVIKADLPPAFDALKQAAREVGSVQIQNRGTVIGNLCNASPAADGVPALLILNANVVLCSAKKERMLPLEDFILGNRKTARCADELVTEIQIPERAASGTSNFAKLGARRYLVISIAMAAVRLSITGQKIDDCSIAIGACSPVAQRLRRLEQIIIGRSRSELASGQFRVAPQTIDSLSPISDVRATADYRKAAAAKLVTRLLQQTAKMIA